MEGIKHASDMLNKLGNIARINNTDVMLTLSPKNYYDLCNWDLFEQFSSIELSFNL